MNTYKVCFTILIKCKGYIKYIDSSIFVNADSYEEAINLVENNTTIIIDKRQPINANLVLDI